MKMKYLIIALACYFWAIYAAQKEVDVVVIVLVAIAIGISIGAISELVKRS